MSYEIRTPKILSEYEKRLIELKKQGKITYLSEQESQKIIAEIYKDFPVNDVFINR